ncbi:SMP-30/gluconolactonase/LRE family protein [Actinoplanes sp. LDG1-06]|uniref:SMP-30/gluconolactonase/LRE family protein n=1 Tax=Paractinoplanes ovalisporus TaxID=2810368 RepID=A0ABS2A2D6_9ACTN|nr:SMP-30/gluconolactonase/LRE family protein [Actinoplanes ovalisporus]
MTLSNGLAWSPDGGTLYSIDSIPGVVYGRDYPSDAAAGVLSSAASDTTSGVASSHPSSAASDTTSGVASSHPSSDPSDTISGISSDIASGGPHGVRRELFRLSEGLPDGLCVDAIGNLWIAVWGEGRVECRTPSGDLLAVVEVDAPHTTSCAFAGDDLGTLVITTATQDLSPADLTRHPASGRLFTAGVGVKGLRTPYWIP